MIKAPLVLFPLMLAACSPQPEQSAQDGEGPAVAMSESSPVASATPALSPTPEAMEQTIPAAARGRWGLVAADCTSTRGDAKGVLVIGATSLKFYESVGQLGAIKERSATRLRASFAFSGEGTNWTRDETLDFQDAGKTMIRREYGADALPGPLKYTKCL